MQSPDARLAPGPGEVTVGIDQSLTCSGWAAWDGGEFVAWGTIETVSAEPLGGRLNQIDKQSRRVLKALNPALILMEGGGFHPASGADNRPAYATGVILLRIYRLGFRLAVRQPNVIKKAWTDDGNASKDQMVAVALEYVPALEDLTKVRRQNVADAMAMAKTAYDLYELLLEEEGYLDGP